MANLPSGSAIPGTVTELLSMATAAFPANTTVWFGAALPSYSAPLTFQITEITGDQTPAEIGPAYRREEAFSVICSLTSYQGGQPDFGSQLAALMANFILFSQAVANNPSLTGNVRFAQVGNFTVTADVDANGQGATTLDFAVRCEARVTSLD